jgi:hypothetical protein
MSRPASGSSPRDIMRPEMKRPRVGMTLLFLLMVLVWGMRASGCRRKPQVAPERRTVTPGRIEDYTPVVFPPTETPAPGAPRPLPG